MTKPTQERVSRSADEQQTCERLRAKPNRNTIDLESGQSASTDRAAGTVWTFASSTSGTDVLNFTNPLPLSRTTCR
ncbi:MAG TPA: hypothetical protein VME46_01990 [Acidimicrobiales bacterium]|nr:hypothetical protein [Acidimicrobiales bacterium]